MKPNNKLESQKADMLLLKGGRLVDPLTGLDKLADVKIEDGVIAEVGKIDENSFNGNVIDCNGCFVMPGLIDMHVHLREPGNEDKETIASGASAAMAGGFTGVCCMPNTNPPVDNRNAVTFIKERSKGFLVDVYPIGAVTKRMEGQELTEMGDMIEGGAVGFSDDGKPVSNNAVMRRAIEYAGMLGHPVIDHCEELTLADNGQVNEGFMSTSLGIKGQPNMAEYLHVARDIALSEYSGYSVHIAHVSTKESVELIRQAKAKGVKITAESCPHYFMLTENTLSTFDTNYKMKPPLRTEEDKNAILDGLKDGTIDVIASDHAPHTEDDKDVEFPVAAFGIIGLETMIGLIFTNLYHKKIMTVEQIVSALSNRVRAILNMPFVKLDKGEKANITVINPDTEWTVDKNLFFSKARNTPFDGLKLKGKAVCAINNNQYIQIPV